ncbi:hypothetical protein BGX27_001618, partial [Mortierella sp. AM989]
VPEIMTKIPVHLIRGQVNLLDKDKVRLERVIKLGAGGSWNQIVDQHKKKVKEEEEAAAAEALANGTPLPATSAKSKSDPDFDSDDEDESGTKDFTAQLTGEVDRKQERKNRKINKLKAKTDGAKVAKKQVGKGGATAGGASKGKSSAGGASSSSGKQMSAVEKAIAASRAESKKKLEQMQNKFGKK